MEYVKNTTFTNVSFFENTTVSNISTKFTGFTYEDVINLVINIYCIPILCVFGIIGNILSIIVLGRDDVMRKTTRFLLQNVAVADIGFLISVTSVHIVGDRNIQNVYVIIMHYMYPVGSIYQTATVYAVVLVTIDRYIAICRPLQSIKLSTMRNARWAVGITWVMAVIFNIPRFFEIEEISYSCGDSDGVMSMCYSVQFTSFRNTKMYRIVYNTVFYFVVRVFTPVLILTICNVKLIKAVRSSRARHDVTHTHQKNTTIMLISIVIMLFICTVPTTVYDLYYNTVYESGDLDIAFIVVYFANLFLVANSAFNFVIYISRGERFRFILWNMFKCHRVRITNDI